MSSRAWTVWGLVAAVVMAPVIVSVADAVMRPQLGIRRRAWIEDHLVLPLFRTRCGGGNEVSAIATLRNVSSSQAQFEASGVADLDHDGVGEFGWFRELSGATVVRGSSARLDPPVLSGVFRTLNAAGEVSRAGYFFRMWLPGADGDWIGESAGGTPSPLLDAEAAEGRWRCLAWPATYDVSGLRTFFIDESGDILATEDERYSGTAAGPAPDAAAGRPSATATSITGADGNVWKQVN